MAKRRFILLFIFIVCLMFISCQSNYRVYNDEELEMIAVDEYGFSEILFFKIVDNETAKVLTGKTYFNSGVIVGIKNNTETMLFVPKASSETAFIINRPFSFDVDDIYQELNELKNAENEPLFVDPSGDFGGLAISVIPYSQISELNSDLVFSTQVFYTFTTDEVVLYVTDIDGEIYVFNSDYEVINRF